MWRESTIREAIRSIIKTLIVEMALRNIMTYSYAETAIRRGGLSDA
jgi:hypothetical protein